ncbi:MAG: methyltransferase type 11 [Actinomycetia bacterium]|nr:methyltransferase type 11 [Actinomycetes bacterium]
MYPSVVNRMFEPPPPAQIPSSAPRAWRTIRGVNNVDVAAIVRDGYDQIAEQYMAVISRPRSADPRDVWTGHLLQRLAPGSTVLDLGCGPGVPTAAAFVGAGHRVVGVDISPGQIGLARRNVPAGSFHVGDVMEFAGEEGSFDAVMALYSLTHVPRDRYTTLFARLVEWLRPGGWLLASMGASDEPGWNEEDFLGFGHDNWTNGYDAPTNRRLLDEAGFDLEMAEIVADDTPFGPERWFWVLGHRR